MQEKRSNTLQLQGQFVKAVRLFENALNLHRNTFQEDESVWGNALVKMLQKQWVHTSGLRYSCNRYAACAVVGHLMALGGDFEPSGYYHMGTADNVESLMQRYGWEVVNNKELEEFIPTIRRQTETQYSVVKNVKN